jgi:hypothetical protein
MPAVRFQRIATPANVQASLVTTAGETLGEINTRKSFGTGGDGWAEIERLPIPVRHQAPHENDPIDDLYGTSALLSVTLGDNRNHVSQATRVILRADSL